MLKILNVIFDVAFLILFVAFTWPDGEFVQSLHLDELGTRVNVLVWMLCIVRLALYAVSAIPFITNGFVRKELYEPLNNKFMGIQKFMKNNGFIVATMNPWLTVPSEGNLIGDAGYPTNEFRITSPLFTIVSLRITFPDEPTIGGFPFQPEDVAVEFFTTSLVEYRIKYDGGKIKLQIDLSGKYDLTISHTSLTTNPPNGIRIGDVTLRRLNKDER